MKKRFGFVSNSSSSSFITYASKEAVDAALAECSEFQKEIANLSLGGEEDFLGRKVRSYSYPSGNNADWWYEELRDTTSYFFEGDFSDEKILESGFELPDENEIDSLDDYINEKVSDFANSGFETLISKKAEELGETTISASFDF